MSNIERYLIHKQNLLDELPETTPIDKAWEEIVWKSWQAARRWISVEEELPEDKVDVLITDCFDIAIGYYLAGWKTWGTLACGYIAESYDGLCSIYLDNMIIKYWQPLPELPKETTDE